ncbi:hypothetical protein [Planomicrobium sp. MB-3u-38]|uniref:hypothetical protein n=1 Tax=Planomicrobium sp. MB-3u-38 TaxID=2058318 RepID=UPI000C7A6D81|nr:hypothetical protein [Planomicrobium sp. MB-3u-38]PKH11137.1 hypothetical protein CXF70_06505 [Planomicrobium sp. MB-3u-38]
METYGGYYNRQAYDIVINTVVTITAEQKFQVLIHEYDHSQQHHRKNDLKDSRKEHREAQAKCTMYIIPITMVLIWTFCPMAIFPHGHTQDLGWPNKTVRKSRTSPGELSSRSTICRERKSRVRPVI